MTVHDAVLAAESLLPGTPAPDGEADARWQAIARVSDFVESNPDEVLAFVLRWGGHESEDLRGAVATLLLEPLVEQHFDHVFPDLAEAAADGALFREMCRMGWYNHGDVAEPTRQSKWKSLLGPSEIADD